jgi:predicted DNA-binding protein with PD1-like motif
MQHISIDPGLDLHSELAEFCNKRRIRFGVVFSAIGVIDNVQLIQLGRKISLTLEGSVELLNASGIIQRENGAMKIDLNIMAAKDGELLVGKLAQGRVADPPEGVVIFVSVMDSED